MENPFQKAEKIPRKLKILIWGEPGTGKTTLALQFPAPAVIDMEGGTELFGSRIDFSVVRTSDLLIIRRAIEHLATETHPHETLIIDPVTVFWEKTQEYWVDVFLKRCQGSKQNKTDFFELGPKEWMQIKKSYKNFLQRLIDLPLNIVCCVRAKVKYREGGYMIADGSTPDCEKSTEYIFDIVIRLAVKGNEYIASVTKDRTNSLKKELKTNDIIKTLFPENEKKNATSKF